MARRKIKTGFNAGKVIAHNVGCVVLAVFLALSLTACGSAESDSNTMAVNTAPNLNANGSVPNIATTTFNNANSFNANSNRPMDEQIKRLEEMRQAANRSGKQIPSLNTRPAPEDSTMTATLTDFARETRTWKKHPVLAKVEKVHDGVDGSIKVHLRSGKVIDLPGKSIAQLDQITAAAVLQLVGLPSGGQTRENSGPKKN
jgi:hypothetical protein